MRSPKSPSRGFTYVFDRVTGEPVWPIIERPVDIETDVPGEKPYARSRFRRNLLRSSIKVFHSMMPMI